MASGGTVPSDLAAGVLAGDRTAIGQAITLVESVLPEHRVEAAALLDGIGAWLTAHGEAIYATRPWRCYGEGAQTVVQGQMTEKRNGGLGAGDVPTGVPSCIASPGARSRARSDARHASSSDENEDEEPRADADPDADAPDDARAAAEPEPRSAIANPRPRTSVLFSDAFRRRRTETANVRFIFRDVLPHLHTRQSAYGQASVMPLLQRPFSLPL